MIEFIKQNEGAIAIVVVALFVLCGAITHMIWENRGMIAYVGVCLTILGVFLIISSIF